MTLSLVKYANVGGEVADSYENRSDLAKYDLAMELCDNWFVDYHGGLSTTPGLELCDYVLHDDKAKLFKFRYASDLANTYIIIMTSTKIRFMQDGAYVLKASVPIQNVPTGFNPSIQATGHGLAVGAHVQFNAFGQFPQFVGPTFKVTAVPDANHFSVSYEFGRALDTSALPAFTGSGGVSEIYSIPHTISTADFDRLQAHQIRDTIHFTHQNYPIYKLVRFDHANWTFSAQNFLNTVPRVSLASISHYAATAQDTAIYCITVVDANGVESLPSNYYYALGINLESDIAGVSLNWAPVAGAQYYNIYRTRYVGGNADLRVTAAMQMGFLGTTPGTSFTDALITPDFATTPPNDTAPFTNGTILNIICTTKGSGYNKNSVITVTDPNPAAGGFIGQLIMDTAGTGIMGVLIISGGHDYSAPVVSVADGTGAVFQIEVQSNSGNNPSCSNVFQQRKVYGSTLQKPLTVFGSKPGQITNFGTSDVILSSDAYQHEIDSEDFSPIRHIVNTRAGMLIFNAANIWLMYGSQSAAISATDVQVDFQTAIGATYTPPLKVNSDILFIENAGAKVQQLSYNDVAKLYLPSDMSLLANHLFSKKNPITSWDYASEPFKMVWARRYDGMMLNFTYIKDQEVFAWSRRTTRGKFMDVICLDENNASSVYCIVKRKINGQVHQYIERVASRDFVNVEDSFHMDCGLRAPINNPAATLQPDAGTGTANFVADAAVFVPGDVGRIIRAGAGKARVLSYVSPTQVTAKFVRDLADADYVPYSTPAYPKDFATGEWSLDSEITTVLGLDHLEGETVACLADGNVYNGLVVTLGSITLPKPCSRINVGIPYKCTAKNLPLSTTGGVIENKRKRITATQIRLKDTRGLKYGVTLDNLYPVKERTDEPYTIATDLMNGMHLVNAEPIWDYDNRQYLVQEDPLPATVLGWVHEVDVGDVEN